MRKRIIIHVGLAKTGSSAIQAFLSGNVGALAAQGISYPFPETVSPLGLTACSGNLIHVIQRRAAIDRFLGSRDDRIGTYLESTVEEAISISGTKTVLLSGEFIGSWITAERMRALEALSARHDVLIVAFVRDVYDWYMSAWKQNVKANGETRDFRARVEADLRLGGSAMHRLRMFLDGSLECRLLNYDRHRRNLVEVFLQAIGADPAAPDLQAGPDRLDNPSLSYSQARQVVMTARHTRSSRLAALLIDRFRSEADARPDPVYEDVDRLLLGAHGELISRINGFLPKEQALRDTPRGGAATEDDGFSTHDMATFMQTVRTLIEGIEDRPPGAGPRRTELPADFDPDEYLLRNPDVAAANADPSEHYLIHGRYEGRSYRAG